MRKVPFMGDRKKSLKAKNIAWIVSVVAADATLICAFVYPDLIDRITISAAAVLRLSTMAVIPVVALLLISLLPANIKAVIVFWRIRHTLPGHRAFSHYGPKDVRFDMAGLKKALGRQLPTEPREQNALWYQLYKKIENEPSVEHAHQHYLLFRDIAALSLLLAIIAPIAIRGIGGESSSAWFVGGFFATQYIGAVLAASINGIAFVTNVLAIHTLPKNA